MKPGLLALVAVAVVLFGFPPSPASAHGTLGMSVPAQGATVSAPLGSVELFFTEKVPDNAHFAVTAPGGGRVDNGWEHAGPRPLDKPVTEYFMVNGKFEPRQYTTGYPARVRVAHLPATGEYRVDYVSKASDGDPVRGTLTFKYTGPLTPAPAGWTPPTDQADPALSSEHGVASAPASAPAAAVAGPPPMEEKEGNNLLLWLGAAAVALVVLAAGVVIGRRTRPAPSAPARTWPPGRKTTAKPQPAAARGAKTQPAAARGAKTQPAAARGADPQPVTAGSADPQPAEGGSAERESAESGPAESGPAESGSAGESRSLPVGPLAVGAVLVALIGGYALGRTTAGSEAPPSTRPAAPAAYSGPAHQHGGSDGGAASLEASGTEVSAGGYTLQPVQRSQPAGARASYAFRIVGADRQPATRYAVVHDKPLHLVVVNRDLGHFQHLHPTMTPDGLWSVPLTLPQAGAYRVFADFTVETAAGATVPLVLGVDHHVPGTATPGALPPAATSATAGPFTVTMEGTPKAGATVPVLFRVTRSGGPVTLEPYLGSYGHLVILREGDLGYVHVHPDPALTGGAVKVAVSIPAAARYRAFLEFQVAGQVQRAEFTLNPA
ncbi:copper resistance protein CopC [Actinoplanes sp. NPDC049596]|uniref:copper resistance protein CopC n=1 Tax=unclassified Actinoplanes TaxID=2626549 RepID=UPI00342695A5